jgi:hypothetical protein
VGHEQRHGRQVVFHQDRANFFRVWRGINDHSGPAGRGSNDVTIGFRHP